MKDRHAADWEELARREPYFAVLTNDGLPGVDGNRVATAAFWETGEEDISALLSAIASLLGRDIPLTTSLDFGCGAGRLTLPLARRATSVVACDVAPTMLVHARKNAQRAGLHNVTFIESDQLAGLRDGQFDFVCSLLVLQYIAPIVGYEIIRTLLRVLAPAGVAALHIAFERPGGGLRRLARMIPSRLAHRAGLAPHRTRPLPQLQLSSYDERVVHRDIDAAGAQVLGRFATHHRGTSGAVLVIQKAPGESR